MTLAIRPVASEADVATFVDLLNETTPEWPTSVEEVRWADEHYPGGARLLGMLDGREVAAAATGRIWMHPAEFEYYWLSIGVREEARRRGLGDALYRAASAVASSDGKIGFQGDLLETRPGSLAFFEHRGFTVYERMTSLRLRVAAASAPEIAPPDGIELTTLAARPDTLPGIHAVAVATFPDIPHVDEPITAGTLEEFRIRDVARPGIPADAFMVALDRADGSVIGYASLMFAPGSTTIAYHDMTAVLPGWRGRGVAGALKRATIAWSVANGVEWLETGTDEGNLPMRAVNARLGYEPTPVLLGLRGPLAVSGAARPAADTAP